MSHKKLERIETAEFFAFFRFTKYNYEVNRCSEVVTISIVPTCLTSNDSL